MKVKITKCDNSMYWYRNMVGEVFDVINTKDEDFVVKAFPDGCLGYIRVQDCAVLSEEETSHNSLENKLKITDAILTVFYNQDTHKMEYQVLLGDEQYETDNEEEMYKILDIACELAEYRSV